jgi:hypothetical protein
MRIEDTHNLAPLKPVISSRFARTIDGCPEVQLFQSKFNKPARLGDTLEITSYISDWKRKTFDMVREVRIDGDSCAEGMEARVCA